MFVVISRAEQIGDLRPYKSQVMRGPDCYPRRGVAGTILRVGAGSDPKIPPTEVEAAELPPLHHEIAKLVELAKSMLFRISALQYQPVLGGRVPEIGRRFKCP